MSPCSYCAALLLALCVLILYFYDFLVRIEEDERSSATFLTGNLPLAVCI